MAIVNQTLDQMTICLHKWWRPFHPFTEFSISWRLSEKAFSSPLLALVLLWNCARETFGDRRLPWQPAERLTKKMKASERASDRRGDDHDRERRWRESLRTNHTCRQLKVLRMSLTKRAKRSQNNRQVDSKRTIKLINHKYSWFSIECLPDQKQILFQTKKVKFEIDLNSKEEQLIDWFWWWRDKEDDGLVSFR